MHLEQPFDNMYQPLYGDRLHKTNSFELEMNINSIKSRCFTLPSLKQCKFLFYMIYQLSITIAYTQMERHYHFQENHYLTTKEWIDQMLVFFLFLVWHLYNVANHEIHFKTWKRGLLFVISHSITMFVWGYISQIKSFQTDLSRMKTWSSEMWITGVLILIIVIVVFVIRLREIIKDKSTITYHPIILTLLTPIFIITLSYILSSKVHIHHWWLFWWLSFFFGNSSNICMLIATSSTMGVFSQSAATYVFGQLL